jgi:hypothetical protein
MVLVSVGDNVSHQESISTFEVFTDEMGEIFWGVVRFQPVAKLVNHFIKNQSSTRVRACGEVMDILIMLFATGAVICDSLFPLRQEPINSAAAGNMFREPVSEGVRKLFNCFWDGIPVEMVLMGGTKKQI